MELSKGMQMAVMSVVKMLMPPDVLKVLTPERVDRFTSEAEALVIEYRDGMLEMRAEAKQTRSTLEALQDELASLNARIDSTSRKGNSKRSGNDSGSSSASDGNPSDAS